MTLTLAFKTSANSEKQANEFNSVLSPYVYFIQKIASGRLQTMNTPTKTKTMIDNFLCWNLSDDVVDKFLWLAKFDSTLTT